MSTSTASKYTDERFRAAARRGQHGMRVPRRWRDALDAQEYALLVALHSMRSTGSSQVVVGQRTVAAKLGRDRDARTDHVGRVAKRLEQAGVIATTRTGRGTGITRYRLLEQGGRYDVIPWPLVRALAAGECTPGEVRTYAYVTSAMAAQGWTSDSAAELADRVGVSTRTLHRHAAALESIGILRVRRVAAAPGLWMLERIDEQASPASKSSTETQDQPPVEADMPVGGSDTDVGSGVDTDVGSYRYLPPERVLTPEYLPPSSRSAPHLSKREAPATSGRKRPSGGIYQVEGIPRVVDLLEQDRAWKWGTRRQWRNGILSKAVAPALEQGLTPEAIAHALITRAADDLDEAAHFLQPLIGPARDALTTLAIDTRLGDACRDCGRTPNEAEQSRLTHGLCLWCHEQHTGPAAVPDLATLEASIREADTDSNHPESSTLPQPIGA